MEKKVIFSALGGAVTLFLLGGLVYGLLLADMMAEYMKAGEACMNQEMPMGIIAVANLVQGVLLALVLDKFGISTFKGGAIAGAWITFLLVLWFDLWMKASFNFFSTNLMVIDIVINTIMGAVAGGVIGLILGKVK